MKTQTPIYDEVIEERIEVEIVVDAYGEYERAMAWCCHLEDKLTFPFKAKTCVSIASSPLIVGEIVTVTGMADSLVCEHDMLVTISWQRRSLAVPLKQLAAIRADEDTAQAISDWHYWNSQGYCF